MWNPEGYAEHARFVSDLGAPVLNLLAPVAGERILDLGCGDGVLTEKIVETGAHVTGVDSSEAMVAAARSRGIDARVMSGEALAFDAEFDAVFSNAAMHWMKRPDLVIAGVRGALKPGGRFVAEFGGYTNTAAVCVALYAVLGRRGVDGVAVSPWYYPSPAEYSSKLEAHGFRVRQIGLIPRPTPLKTDMRGWLTTFTLPFFAALPESERGLAMDETIALLKPVLCDERGAWIVDYVRLRFAAELIA